MAEESSWDQEPSTAQRAANGSNVGLAVALAALAAIGAGIAIQQLFERRLSKPELARLRFYRYLRERGHLES